MSCVIQECPVAAVSSWTMAGCAAVLLCHGRESAPSRIYIALFVVMSSSKSVSGCCLSSVCTVVAFSWGPRPVCPPALPFFHLLLLLFPLGWPLGLPFLLSSLNRVYWVLISLPFLASLAEILLRSFGHFCEWCSPPQCRFWYFVRVFCEVTYYTRYYETLRH